jgi:two-component system chemotaxis sensor kinase CheA
MEFDNELLLSTFIAEGKEILAEMEQALLALEAQPDDEETVRAVFRCAHTLKGSAACVGLDGIAAVVHRVEDYLDRLREGETEITATVISGLLTFVDSMGESLAAAAEGRDFVPKAALDIADALKATSSSPMPAAAPASAAIEEGKTRTVSIRVDTARLDRALDLTGEISIARGRLRQRIDQARPLDEISEACGDVERLSGELQELVMKLRMVPVGPFFRQYWRTVRDVATAHQKRARLVLEGEDAEVDLAVIEHLRNPLTHLIRNAVDHGIETPAERGRLGKPEEGRVTLGAYRDAGTIVIRVGDDGGGLDRNRIAAAVRARGLAAEPEKLADNDLYRFIFVPGFSTAEQVTDISGRGVGMEIVRRNVEELHGSVSVESGRGTTVTLRLPLTVAIIDGFVVTCGREFYVLPLDSVVECLAHRETGGENACFGVASLRGEPMPYVRLGRYLRLEGTGTANENMVVVSADGRRAGIVVDALLGERQVVIKPLGKLLQRISGLAGSAVLGNGRVAMVLDVAELLESCVSDVREEITRVSPAEPYAGEVGYGG